MKTQISRELSRIEVQKMVRIFYACESGSRAWGFASKDSDYDVRFLYMHPPEWYLCINVERKRDVIERKSNALDLSGWDLRKALQLFRKSNPPLLEWLQSPIVYKDALGIADAMRNLLPTCYSPKACMYHYYHMAENNFRVYLKGPSVWIKKYLYVLRPILAIRWIEKDIGPVPMEFDKLLDETTPPGMLKSAMNDLLQAKKIGLELGFAPIIPDIQTFIQNEMERLKFKAAAAYAPKPPIEPLNLLFRTSLHL